ncbi:hypothetical protein [Actinomadura monticuli]|uniref:Uncharacterized protein n=1 Tax=Actinomadura monticuli TaxID=3097367 RepID=A0ABV4QKA6_9ACTN
MQSDLSAVLDRAGDRAGLRRSSWWIQEAGDGEVSVLPDGEPEPRVVDDYVRHLYAELRRHNRDVPAGRELRLRMAVHYGPAFPAAKGHAGAGLVVASRLCDSEPLRRALDGTGAPLAVVLSERVFAETVAEEHTTLDPADFRQVTVRMKEFKGQAWILVPGHDLEGIDLDTAGTDDDRGVAPGPGGGTGTDADASPPPGAPGAQPSVPRAEGSVGDYAGAQIHTSHFVGRDETNYYGHGGDR